MSEPLKHLISNMKPQSDPSRLYSFLPCLFCCCFPIAFPLCWEFYRETSCPCDRHSLALGCRLFSLSLFFWQFLHWLPEAGEFCFPRKRPCQACSPASHCSNYQHRDMQVRRHKWGQFLLKNNPKTKKNYRSDLKPPGQEVGRQWDECSMPVAAGPRAIPEPQSGIKGTVGYGHELGAAAAIQDLPGLTGASINRCTQKQQGNGLVHRYADVPRRSGCWMPPQIASPGSSALSSSLPLLYLPKSGGLPVHRVVQS